MFIFWIWFCTEIRVRIRKIVKKKMQETCFECLFIYCVREYFVRCSYWSYNNYSLPQMKSKKMYFFRKISIITILIIILLQYYQWMQLKWGSYCFFTLKRIILLHLWNVYIFKFINGPQNIIFRNKNMRLWFSFYIFLNYLSLLIYLNYYLL